MNIAAAVIPFWGAIKTFQAATSPAAICCVLRLDTIASFGILPNLDINSFARHYSKVRILVCWTPSTEYFLKLTLCETFCHGSTVWLGSSVVRVLARYARGPGFESRSGHVLFPTLWHLVAQCGSVLGLRAAKRLSRRFRHGSEQIRRRI